MKIFLVVFGRCQDYAELSWSKYSRVVKEDILAVNKMEGSVRVTEGGTEMKRIESWLTSLFDLKGLDDAHYHVQRAEEAAGMMAILFAD